MQLLTGERPASLPSPSVWHGEFRDPRLVEFYDAECPWSRDDDYFAAVVEETPGARVLDLGCGTGRLAIGLARAGHAVTGVEPARASLEAARRKPGSERVTWIEGTSGRLAESAFDVAVMTSHVAQLFTDDAEWARTLHDLARALVPGGRLAFDARDPLARGWERWNPVDSRRQVRLPHGGLVSAWTEVNDVDPAGVITFTHHYDLPTGDQLVSTARLRFRTEAELRTSLREAGFAVDHVFGGWERQPVGHAHGELLVVARRVSAR